MATYSFPALGFDPAPGDPDEVESVGRQCVHAARELEEDAARLEALQSSGWSGEASDAVQARVGRLRRDYSASGRAYGALGSVLLQFSEALRDAQFQARRVEAEAAEAKRRMEVLGGEVERLEAELKLAPAGVDTGPVFQELMDARRRWSWAEEDYQAARAAAQRIQEAFEEEGETAARRLRAIDPPPYQPPRRNLFHQAAGWAGDRVDSVAQAVDRYVDEHGDVLRSISGPLKTVSAAAGLLSFVPVFTPICAPIAAGTAAAALGLDATLVVAGHGAWKAVVVDGALMAVPVAGRLASRAVMGSEADA
jgi:uncharacterized protein YukE